MMRFLGRLLTFFIGITLIAAGALWYFGLWPQATLVLADWVGVQPSQILQPLQIAWPVQLQPPQSAPPPANQPRQRTRAGGAGAQSPRASQPGQPPVQGTYGSCPPPVTGQFTSAADGRRIKLNLLLQGPAGQQQVPAILDSGAVQTSFPDNLLRSLGYRPISGPDTVGGVGSGTSIAYTYRIPYPFVADRGRWAPLGSGTLEVEGIRGFDMVLIGPDVLERGVSLQTSGSQWTLTLPCAKN